MLLYVEQEVLSHSLKTSARAAKPLDTNKLRVLQALQHLSELF